jgi:O-antigen ligase
VRDLGGALARARLSAYDLVGAGFVTLFAAWIFVTAVARAGNPWPQVVLIVAATAAYGIGRTRGGRRPVLAAAAVVVGILTGTLLSGPAAFTGGPLAPPLGYANANGALFALGAAAAAIVGTATDKELVRQPALMFGVLMLTMAALNTSVAAATLTAGILASALIARWLGRWVALVAPLLVSGVVATTVALGLTYGTGIASALEEELTERRRVLWHDALEITATEPVFGVGPGRFAVTSPTALSDADAVWAHSAYLEVAAEHGIPGAVLLCALLLWVFGGLYRSHQNKRIVVIGTATATAVTVHAAVDYVAHFLVVVIVAALLVGLASSRALPRAAKRR